jgi:formimidoylglutamate deiminase
VLAPDDDESRSALAKRLFSCATEMGGESLGLESGTLSQDKLADFFTVDLNDASIAGATNDDLISSIVFSLARTAVKDVVVGGKMIVKDGQHKHQEEIVHRFKALQRRLWG